MAQKLFINKDLFERIYQSKAKHGQPGYDQYPCRALTTPEHHQLLPQ